jgi:hypothetical protein
MRIIETFLRGQPKKRPTPVPPKDQDRHIMRSEPMLDTRSYAHRLCWLSADNGTGRTLTPISSTKTTQKPTIEVSKSPVARSRLQYRHPGVRKPCMGPIGVKKKIAMH